MSEWPRFTGFPSAPDPEWIRLAPSLSVRGDHRRRCFTIEPGDPMHAIVVDDAEAEALRDALTAYLDGS